MPEREQHAAAAEVADQVERRHRRRAGAADRVQHAGERDVVDVVAGALGERAVLAPAGHAAVDEARIAREHDVGPEAEALHHAGTEAFDQRVGASRRGASAASAPCAVFRSSVDRAAAAQHDVEAALAAEAEARIGGAVDEQHVGAHVGEHHPGERARADRFELEDAQAGERSHALHVAPVLAADLVQRVGDLAERADAHGVDQHVEDVAAGDHGLLQALERRRRLARRCAPGSPASRASWLCFSSSVERVQLDLAAAPRRRAGCGRC